MSLLFQPCCLSLRLNSESVQAGNVATVRQYQEAIIVNLMLREPEVLEQHVLPALLRYETR